MLSFVRLIVWLMTVQMVLIWGAVALRRGTPPQHLMVYTGVSHSATVLKVLDGTYGLAVSLAPSLPPHADLNFYNWNSNGQLVYAAQQDGIGEIFLTDLLHYTNISEHPASDEQPALGPDGRIAFISDRSGYRDLYIWEAGALTNLTQSPEKDAEPAWSQDGRLAWIYAENKLMVYAGENIEQVAIELGGWVVSPTWSRDGRLAWCAYRALKCDLMIWNGLAVERIARSSVFTRPVWSADGRLVFKSDQTTISIWQDGAFESIQPAVLNIGFPAWDFAGRVTFNSLYPIVGNSVPFFRSHVYRWSGGQLRLLLNEAMIESPVWMPEAREPQNTPR